MKKLLILLLTLFTLTGCFCSKEKEEIRKGEETAKKEMIEYLSKYYGINEVYTVKAENTYHRYSCSSFIGLVSAYFDYQGKKYGILYNHGKIQDELSYEQKIKPILIRYFDNNLSSYNLPNIENVILEDSNYYFKGKTLYEANGNINSFDGIINEFEISTIRIYYENDSLFLKDKADAYEKLLENIRSNFKTIYDDKKYISLIVDSYSNGKLKEELLINLAGVSYNQY